jgi:hypothetical protein
VHHVRSPVDDFASSTRELQRAGSGLVMEGHVGEVASGYLQVPMLNGMVIELIEMPGG